MKTRTIFSMIIAILVFAVACAPVDPSGNEFDVVNLKGNVRSLSTTTENDRVADLTIEVTEAPQEWRSLEGRVINISLSSEANALQIGDGISLTCQAYFIEEEGVKTYNKLEWCEHSPVITPAAPK